MRKSFPFSLKGKSDFYRDIILYVTDHRVKMASLKFYKVKPKGFNGEIPDPKKAHSSDVGWDIFLIKCIESNGEIFKFDTGIVVEPPSGVYTMLCARSSLYKSGYSLATGCPGVIDSSYKGTLQVVLRKHNYKTPDIILPFPGVQLIAMPLLSIDHEVWNITKEEHETLIKSTKRGAGGFGSTGI